MNITGFFERRRLLKAATALGGLFALYGRTAIADGEQQPVPSETHSDDVRMEEIPFSSSAKVTVERRGDVVLIGINRPHIHNRIDPETYAGLAKIGRAHV